METPIEKAKRLNVPFAYLLPNMQRQINEKKYEDSDELKKMLSTITKICECGREFTIGEKEHSCGRDNCPFGYEHFIKKISSMNTTRQLPPDTKKGFTEWQKWIETEASKQIVTLTAADIIHSHFPKSNKINK